MHSRKGYVYFSDKTIVSIPVQLRYLLPNNKSENMMANIIMFISQKYRHLCCNTLNDKILLHWQRLSHKNNNLVFTETQKYNTQGQQTEKNKSIQLIVFKEQNKK